MRPSDDRLRREIDDEVQAHLNARTEYLIAQGLPPSAARAEALRRFGDLEAGRAALLADATARQRRRRVRQHVDSIAHDVRYVIRSLRRQPAFTSGVVFTFALGLGINTAIFRVADLVLFKPPAGVRAVQAVRQLETTVSFGSGDPMRATTFSWPDARRLAGSGVLAAASAGTLPRQLALPDGRAVSVSYVDHEFFPLLGVVPSVGRVFAAEEGRPGGQVAVAVVSRGFWQRVLGGQPLDTIPPVTIGARAFDVVGILPAGFTGIDLDPTDVWLPLGVADLGRGFANGVAFAWYESEMARPLRFVGRLSPDATEPVVVDRLSASLATATADPSGPVRRAVLRPIVPVGRAAATEASNRLILRLAVVAGVVLLIAAANATNLLLARGVRRQRELAIRAAIGASRGRLARLLFVESLLLALAGGVAALIAGGWTAEALRRLLFPDGRWTAAGVDSRSLLFTCALAVVAGLFASLAPMLQSTGFGLLSTLKDGRTRAGGRSHHTRAALLVTQTAFTLALVAASGLLVRSLLRLGHVPLGFDPRGLVTASLTGTAPERIMRGPAQPTMAAFVDAVRARGPVKDVALASVAPFGTTARTTFTVPGSSFRPASDDEQAQTAQVSANYFAVMGTRVTMGRAFTAADVAGEPVAVVNASMARAYWGESLPPGACILLHGSPCARVVGVVEDLRDSPAGGAPLRFYLPLLDSATPSAVVVRTTEAGAPALLGHIRVAAPPDYRVNAEIIRDRIDRALRPWRTAAWLFATLGVVALALACGGIYSVMAYIAAARTREIGVRIALGATRADVLRLILGGGVKLVVIGGVIGLGLAAGGGRLLGTLLFGVSPFDPVVYGTSFACVAAAALLATLRPATRAARTDAVVALRQE